MKEKQAVDTYRKKPSQSRSGATVEAIFEAAARILQDGGLAAFTTNSVAELAGISVGTLYQYFRNKDAILLALAERELGQTPDRMISALGRTEADQDPTILAVRALLKAFGGRQRFRKILIEALIARGLSEALARPVEKVAKSVLEKLRNGSFGYHFDPSPAQIFVLTRAIIGAVRAAVMEESELLDSPELERELATLLKSYVQMFEVVPGPPAADDPKT